MEDSEEVIDGEKEEKEEKISECMLDSSQLKQKTLFSVHTYCRLVSSLVKSHRTQLIIILISWLQAVQPETQQNAFLQH